MLCELGTFRFTRERFLNYFCGWDRMGAWARQDWVYESAGKGRPGMQALQGRCGGLGNGVPESLRMVRTCLQDRSNGLTGVTGTEGHNLSAHGSTEF